ncbi:DUF6199 family natural product biosynthesis protein [Streptomyces pilosus]
MVDDAMTLASSDGGSPALVPIMSVLMIMGLVQVVRPQLIWRLNTRLQRGWVKNPEATEPTRRGYTMQRVSGVLFLAVATWILVRNL